MPNAPVRRHSSKNLLALAKKQDADERRTKIMAEQEKQLAPPQPKPTVLTAETIAEAWSIISPAGHSVLTKAQVLDNMRLLFPRLTAKEVKELVGTGNMSVNKLTNLLLHADVPAVDANFEAFKILDPQGTGYVDAAVFRRLLEQVHGVGQVDEADMQLIMQLCDADKDGRISLKDFSTIGSWAPVKEQPTEYTRKLMLEKLKEARGMGRPDD